MLVSSARSNGPWLSPAIAGDGLTTPPTRTRPGGRRRLGVLLGAVVAAVVVALVILVAVLNRGGDVIIADPTPTTTVKPTPTKSATRRATPSKSPSPSTRPTLQLTVGQTANFTSFDVTVASITADAAFGVLVDAERMPGPRQQQRRQVAGQLGPLGR